MTGQDTDSRPEEEYVLRRWRQNPHAAERLEPAPPPGDAALTRRVKAAGEHWNRAGEKRPARLLHGVWAPAVMIETNSSRARCRAFHRRVRQAQRVGRSSPASRAGRVCRRLHRRGRGVCSPSTPATPIWRIGWRQPWPPTPTPVGSGTVARTKRIPIERRPKPR